MDRDHLEQLTHLVGAGKTLSAGCDLPRAIGIGARQRPGARPMPSRMSHSPCGDERRDRGAGLARRSRDGFEIDMGGQILFARDWRAPGRSRWRRTAWSVSPGALVACP